MKTTLAHSFQSGPETENQIKEELSANAAQSSELKEDNKEDRAEQIREIKLHGTARQQLLLSHIDCNRAHDLDDLQINLTVSPHNT